MMIRVIVLLLLMYSCAKAESKPSVEPDDNSGAAFVGVEKRALTFLDQGFIVSRRTSISINQGDSLLFTGLAAYAMDCDHGNSLSLSMAQMVDGLDGGLYRHPNLPGSISLDGALGFYRGITKRANLCGEGAQWGHLIAQHLAYVDAHGGLLNASDVATLPIGFDYIPRKLLSNMGDGPEPSASSQAALETAITGWAAADMAVHGACYRLNLGLITLQTVEQLGSKISTEGKFSYCEATKGSGIPTIDQWCGRGGLPDWLNSFQWDVYQYRHQRCAGWEPPDANGDSEPAVDYLVGWADYNDY